MKPRELFDTLIDAFVLPRSEQMHSFARSSSEELKDYLFLARTFKGIGCNSPSLKSSSSPLSKKENAIKRSDVGSINSNNETCKVLISGSSTLQ